MNDSLSSSLSGAADARSHTLARHRDILHDYTQVRDKSALTVAMLDAGILKTDVYLGSEDLFTHHTCLAVLLHLTVLIYPSGIPATTGSSGGCQRQSRPLCGDKRQLIYPGAVMLLLQLLTCTCKKIASSTPCSTESSNSLCLLAAGFQQHRAAAQRARQPAEHPCCGTLPTPVF